MVRRLILKIHPPESTMTHPRSTLDYAPEGRAHAYAEAPPASRRYEITPEGWAVVESNTVEIDIDHIDKIFP
jgi:hypothetical protein